MRKNIILFLFVSLLMIVLFEFVGQNILFKDELYFIDNVDHRMKPNSRIDINSDGIRSLVESNNFAQGAINIEILGDSFIYGKVDYDKTIPQMLETKLRYENPKQQFNVANFGWISSSPLLSLRLLKDIGKKYNPDIVILAIDMTDFHDDIKYTQLLEREGIYSFIDLTPTIILTIKKILVRLDWNWVHEGLFGFPIKRFFITDSPLSESRYYLNYIQDNIDKIKNYTINQLEAEFILVIFPRSFQYSDKECPKNWEKLEYEVLGPYAHEPFKYFEQLKGKVDYPIYSLLPNFQNTDAYPTVFDDDPHWNETGNKIAVDGIYEFIKR